MRREPGVLQSRRAGLPTTIRPRKGDYLEANSRRIAKCKLGLALVGKPVLFVGDPIQATGTEQIASLPGRARRSALVQSRLDYPSANRGVGTRDLQGPVHAQTILQKVPVAQGTICSLMQQAQ